MSKPATLSKLMVAGLLGALSLLLSKAGLSTVSSPALIRSGTDGAPFDETIG
jgi:hypothetical protein